MAEGRLRYLSRLKLENPALLAEIARKGATCPERQAKPRRVAGCPRNMTNREWAVQLDKARKVANRVMERLDMEGSLPEQPVARRAMQAAVEMLAADLRPRDRMAVVRTLLEYNLAKPPSAQTVSVRTAEGILEELAASEVGK